MRFMLEGSFLPAAALALALTGSGCGGTDESGDGASDTVEEGEDGDLSQDGLQPDCAFPAPRVAGTPEADALAADPGRCGQQSFQWLSDPALGDVLSVERERGYSLESLRSLAESLDIVIPVPLLYDAVVRQVLYVTQDRGSLIEATTLVGYPINVADGRDTFDVLLLLHGTFGFTDGCDISGDNDHQMLASLLVAMGYVVVAPDYIGLKGLGDPTGFLHPYLVGMPTAMASLDAVRAAGKLDGGQRGNLCMSERVVVFGASQGGHAALWVDRLASAYAPELEIAGIVASVPPADMLGQVQLALTAPMDATGNTIAFFSAASFWYGVDDRLDEFFIPPLDGEVPEAMAASCNPEDDLPSHDVLEDVFQPAVLEAAANGELDALEPWGCMASESGLTTTSIGRHGPSGEGYGILFVLSGDDELVNALIERASFETLCSQGMPLEYLECAGADHTDGVFWSWPEMVEFLAARLAGEAMDPARHCVLEEPVTCRGTP